jgi:hypothetical protein
MSTLTSSSRRVLGRWVSLGLAGLIGFVLAASPAAHAAPDPAAAAAPAAQAAPQGATADSPEALFAQANRLYFAGDWRGSAEAYAKIVERFEIEDPALYHNLGNAYFRSGAYGSAILYYKRALRLEPDKATSEAIAQNLDAARRILQARYRASSDASLVYGDPSGIVYQVTHLVGDTVLAIVFGVLWLSLFLLLSLRRLRPPSTGVLWPGRLAVPVAVLVGLAGFLLWGRLSTDASQRIGVVIASDAKLRDGKHEVAQGRDLPEGLEVRILDGDEAWTQVELAGGRRGWVTLKDVKQI